MEAGVTQQRQNGEWVASERLTRSILDQATEAIVVCDQNGRIVRTSQMARSLCACNPISRPFEDAFPLYFGVEQHAPRVVPSLVSKPLEGEVIRDLEVSFRREGKAFHLILSARPLRDEEDRVRGCVITLTDITERKRDEEEVRRLNKDLKRKLIELQTINKELKAFNNLVSHDLCTQLLVIDVFSRKLIERYSNQLDAKGQQFLDFLRKNIQNMRRLIGDFLTFFRLECSKVTSLSTIDMGELAQTVFEEFRLIEPQRTLHLKIEGLPAARGNEAMIRQVFVNLLSNAIKFTRFRKVAMIEVGGRMVENHNLYFVRDNGIGFEGRDADKLFNLFQRLHGTEEFEGTGVGLALVKLIIQRHGGRAWAEGKVDGGATFYFTLPHGRPETEIPKKSLATAGRRARQTPLRQRKAKEL